MKLEIAGGSKAYIDSQFSPERTINMYQDIVPGSEERALIMIPGSQLRFTYDEGSNTRALKNNKVNLFAVYEDKVVKHDQDLNDITIGTLATTAGVVRIAGNNQGETTFVDGIEGWVYNGTTFTQITSEGFPATPVDVDFLDGHMLIAIGGTNSWIISNVDSATEYDPLNTARITSDEEKIVGIRVVNRRIFVFGQNITEIFYNSRSSGLDSLATSSFPFVRDNNQVLQYGCASLASIAQEENILVWLATRKDGGPTVRMTSGGEAKKISDTAVEYSLQSYTNLAACYGFMYTINGHTFYCLNNPIDNKTWCYDFTMDVWHEQQMINGNYYFASTHSYYKGKHYLGHYAAPKLSEMKDVFTFNDNENIHCLRIPPTVRDGKDLQRLVIDRLELQGFQGRGAETLENGQFELDPKVYLSVSLDGGKTYGNPISMTTGKVGEFDWETIWINLGVGKSFTFKFETFHRAKTGFLRADLKLSLTGY
jgi:Phage stabilisation protein